MTIITGFFNTQAAVASKTAEDQARRVAVIVQVWKGSRKTFKTQDGTPFNTFRAKLVDFDTEKGEALGLVKGEAVRLRYFENAKLASTEGLDPFTSGQYFLAAWLQLDPEKFQGKGYDKVDELTGLIETVLPEPVTQGRIRGGAFGQDMGQALANMEELSEALKAEKKAKAEAKKAQA